MAEHAPAAATAAASGHALVAEVALAMTVPATAAGEAVSMLAAGGVAVVVVVVMAEVGVSHVELLGGCIETILDICLN